MTEQKKSVAGAILKVSFSVGKITKNGTNDHFKFKYQAWDDVLPEVRNACVEHGLTVVPNVTQIITGVKKVTVMVNFILLCGDDRLEVGFAGEANDNDDKAIQKAITSATKYFFLKTFMIPCQGDVDPDGLGEDKPKTERAPTKQSVAKAEVASETGNQNARAERAKAAFATLGCTTVDERKVYEAQAKAAAVINSGDWVDELEKIAKELVAA